MSPQTPEFLAGLQQKAASILSEISLPANAEAQHGDGGFQQACQYALAPGGKYIRPILALCAAEACNTGADRPATAAVVAALELIHTYSLIHDDLPAMDDDDMRRGRATLHVAYGEATAVLVGDSLQARAFELLADAPDLSDAQKVGMIKVLANAAGAAGMVGGQYIDIEAVDSEMTLEELQTMHSMKTGALIRASVALGGIAAQATKDQLQALDDYATHIGLAFQVVDDILDVAADTETLGKTAGKDVDANKPTYVKLLGVEGARAEAQRLLASGLEALDVFDSSADQLRELAKYIVARDR